MAEIKMSDGTLFKVPQRVEELRQLVQKKNFLAIKDGQSGKEHDINPDQISWMRDN